MMGKPAPVIQADQLRALVAAVQESGSRILDEQTMQGQSGAPFTYVPAPGLPARSIPAAQFSHPYALTLAGVELTLYGYCVLRRAGAVFILGDPPLWRLLLRPPPLLSLRFSAHGKTVAASIGMAGRRSAGSAVQRCAILLAPDMQEALLRLHREHHAGRSLLRKLRRWRT